MEPDDPPLEPRDEPPELPLLKPLEEPLDELDELDAVLMLEDALDDPPDEPGPDESGPEEPGPDEPADDPESVELAAELICELPVDDDADGTPFVLADDRRTG